jgi:hypothetical protein
VDIAALLLPQPVEVALWGLSRELSRRLCGGCYAGGTAGIHPSLSLSPGLSGSGGGSSCGGSGATEVRRDVLSHCSGL